MNKKSLFVVGIIVVVLTILFLFNPTISSFYPSCPLNKMTGLYCPGCGTQRAAHEILHGNVMQALNLNALFVLSLPFVVYYSFIEISNKLFKTNFKNLQLTTKQLVGLIIIAVVFMILRNIETVPFNWLAP